MLFVRISLSSDEIPFSWSSILKYSSLHFDEYSTIFDVSVQKCHNAPICGLFAKPANFIFKFLSLKISLIQADCHRKQVLIVRSTRFHCFE